MCLPLAGALSLGISAASTAGSIIGGLQQASALNAYHNRVAERNRGLAEDQANQQYLGINRRVSEDRLRAAAEIDEISKQSRGEQSTALTEALERGIAGTSVQDLYADYERQRLDYSTAVSVEQRLRERNAELSKKGVRTSLEGALISATPNPVQGPNIFGELAGFAATGLKILDKSGVFRKDTTNDG